MTKCIQLRTLCTPLFMIASIFACSSSFAVTMEVTVGFNGVLKSSVWTPIAVHLTNSSSEDVQGEIILSDANGNMNQMTVCTTEVNLPAKSQKLYHSYVRLTGYGGEFVVTLAQGRGILARKQVNLNMASTEDRVIVTVGNRSSRLGFLQGETIKITPAAPPPGSSYSSGSGRSEAALFAGSLDSKILPDRPAAYEGANLIVLSELTPTSANPNALKAIGMWVASGGTLVIPTGPDSKRFTDPFYTDLLPVTINGAANITGSTDMAAMGNAQFPAGACAVANSSVKPGIGRLIASAGAVPLIVERAYGAGRVIFMAFDIKSSPFRDWNGQTEFWKNILRMPTSQPMVDSIRTIPDQNRYSKYYGGPSPYASMGMMETVAQNPSVKMPSFNTIGLFLLGYIIILVPVNYFLLKKKRRLELAWVTTPLIVIAFTLGAYAIGYTMKGGDLQLREAVVIEGSSGARFARMVSNATLFSPARRSYDVSIDDPSAISQVVATEENESTPVTYLGEKSTIPDVGMAMWSSKTFEAVGGADLGGAINSRLMLSSNKLTGEIRNDTNIPFKSCVLSYNNSQQDFGALNPGDSVKVDMNISTNGRAAFGSSELDQKLDGYLSGKIVSAGPVLIGVPAKDAKIIDLPNNTLKASRAVRYIFRLDYAVAGSFKLSEQSISGQIIEMDNGQYYNQNMSKQAGSLVIDSISPKAKVTCMFRLPVPTGGKITSLHIKETSNAPNFSYSFYNYTSSKWEPFIMGAGITISNAAKYVGANNEVRLKAVNTSTDYRSIRLRLSAQGTSL
ncbi:MAG: hypothetical protein NT018_04610 [Armatimonadetes bacterium]|nr:hypothetical protein [Armatimonadota bacterium]